MTTDTAAPAADDAADTSEFDAAFAEFAATHEDGRDDGAGDTLADDEDALPGEPADGLDGSGGDDADPKQAAQDDPWAAAPADLRAAYEAAQQKAATLEHQLRSDRGRLGALTRQLEDARRTAAPPAADAKATQQQPQTGPDKGSPAEEDDPEIAAFREEYPDVAGPVTKLIAPLLRTTAEFQAWQAEQAAAAAKAAADAQEKALAEIHPDWEDVTGDRKFLDWLNTQPSYVLDAARRNGDGIVDATEAGDIIARFKAQNPGFAATKPAAPAASPNTTDQRRQRQLQSASPISSRTPGTAGGAPNDFEAAFEHFASKRARSAQR